MMSRGVRHILILFSLVLWSTTSARQDDAEWFGTDEPTTKVYGTRRTTTGEAEFIPRTSKKPTPPPPNATFRPSSAFAPTNNLTDTMTTLLKNFAKLITTADDEHSTAHDCGNECLTNVVRLEMFTIAGGDHFVLPSNTDEKIERNQRKKASAVGALWLDLFCSEDIDAILTNVTRETVTRQYPTTSLTQNKMYEILQNVFDKLDDAIEEDTFMATMYTAEQIRYTARVFDASSADSKKVHFPFDKLSRGGVTKEMVVEWSTNVDMRKFLIHKQFLESKYEKSNDEADGGDTVAVRSILKVARERCCIDRMQKIYTSILDEGARNFAVADYPNKVTRTFIDKLTRAVENDEKLTQEWTKIKKEMLDEMRLTRGKGRRVNDI